jgi:hypothetical protein
MFKHGGFDMTQEVGSQKQDARSLSPEDDPEPVHRSDLVGRQDRKINRRSEICMKEILYDSII